MMPYNYGYGAPFSGWEFLWHIVMAIVILWVVITILRMVLGRGPRHWRRHAPWHAYPALEILEERFAKGEITKEEFEERRKTLVGN